MGVFSRIERRLEHGVGNAFARMFKGKVHPAEIARALQQDADDNATKIGRGRTLVPNRYVVWLGDTDYDHLVEWEKQLTRSLADICREHFGTEGYSTHGAVKVEFARSESLRTGIFQIESRVDDAEPSVPLRDYLPFSRSANPAPPVEAPQPAQDYPPIPGCPAASPAYPGAANPSPAAPGPALAGQAPQHPAYAGASYEPPRDAGPRYRHIVVIDAEDKRVPLHEGRNVLGRGSAADVRINDTGISRQHAEITTDGVLATIIDLQSTNGTLVNGKRISRSALRHGDVIRLGRSVLVYRYEPEATT